MINHLTVETLRSELMLALSLEDLAANWILDEALVKCLLNDGIEYIGEVLPYTRKELKLLDGFGDAYRSQLITFLDKIGMQLETEIEAKLKNAYVESGTGKQRLYTTICRPIFERNSKAALGELLGERPHRTPRKGKVLTIAEKELTLPVADNKASEVVALLQRMAAHYPSPKPIILG